MKIFKKNSIITVLAASLVTAAFSLAGPATAFASTDPGLGTAATFSILAQTAITGTGTISGNVGINSTGAGITGLTTGNVAGIIYSTDGVAPSVASPFLDPAVQANASTANSNMSAQSSTGSIGPALDSLVLSTGVYDIGAGRLNGGVLTLNGPGTYILRASSDFISSGSINLTNGARACDVYWQVNTLATINGSSFVGTIIAGTGVHFGSNVALNGRALAIGGDVTMINNTISGPTCAAPATDSPNPGTVNVVKVVVNDNGGTNVIADFPLFVNGTPVTSGATNTFPTNGGVYSVTETGSAKYTRTFSGDCDANGQLNLNPGNNKFCIVTNNDIGAPVVVPPVPPLIDVVKTASPLALPVGPGPVIYTYTLRNIGTVPVTNVTMVGDTCSPIILTSGDTNNDANLDVNETWVYHCSWNLTQTHTNTVVATGWANGISATDIASATVVVGAPIIPPLIHVVKTPSVFTLPASGGAVTYTYTVTNPGTAPLSNLTITDDKCTGLPGRYNTAHPGDVNQNNLLDPGETFNFTCQSNLTQTTTNTATAQGSANGLTARDFAIATVIVAAPGFPNAGFPPQEKSNPWNLVILSGILMLISASFVITLKKFLV